MHRVITDSTPNKPWYILNSGICGFKPAQFLAQNSTFKKYPDEFSKVHISKLKDSNGVALEEVSWFNRNLLSKNNEVPIASSFGVLVSLLRQNNPNFLKAGIPNVIDRINQIDIKDLIDLAPKSNVDSKDAQIQTENVASIANEVKKRKAEKLDVGNGDDKKKEQKKRKKGEHDDQWKELNGVSEKYRVPLATVIGERLDLQDEDALEMLNKIAAQAAETRGNKKAFNEMLGDTSKAYLQSLRPPDWALLYFKLESRIPDEGWQTLINISNLGRTGNNSDTPLLLNKNQIKAIRKLVFQVVRQAMGIRRLPDWDKINGYEVNLHSAVVWAAREQRLHDPQARKMELNLKLDGRPFFGKDQVMIGVVPIHTKPLLVQSAKSVFPIAIANCKEDR